MDHVLEDIWNPCGRRALCIYNKPNFVGRMGHVDSEVYLASPAVARQAVTGKISSPEEVM